jgi:hypothetical protein
MARSILEIQQSIITAKQADSILDGLSSTSAVAIWRLWTYIVAVCQWTLENLFDAHKAEVASIIALQKPHTLQWYVAKAKQFQFGVTLSADTDTYASDTTDPAVRIISYAAAVEMPTMVRIKAATLSGASLNPLTASQLTAFTAYMQQIKDAGVRLQITSDYPDELRLALTVYYDPLVLDGAGARLDGTATSPVKNAVNNFLANLPFNGVFVVNHLVAAIQGVDGVVIGHITSVAARYGALAFAPIAVEYMPDAGYMILDDSWFDANVSYVSHAAI